MEERLIKTIRLLIKAILFIFGVSIMLLSFSLYLIFFPQNHLNPQSELDAPKIITDEQIISGIHQPTGLVADVGLPLVIQHCTNCHSAQLIIQNSATREGWKGLIRWMQQTQNLWDLGENEPLILDYLGKHYAPKKKGRRSNIHLVEWYPYTGD